MALDQTQAREFSHRLTDWFWQHGLQRKGNYALELNGWLRELCEARNHLGQAEEAGRSLRPAFAIWGPSQTGKSTFLSNFLDERLWEDQEAGDPDSTKPLNGTLSGLYWAGGEPCVFDVPPSKTSLVGKDIVSLNPYNGGKDASAVLSRFVLGSLDGANGTHRIRFAEYPNELRFGDETDVMRMLAMGYDGDCLGQPQDVGGGGVTWKKKSWTREEFLNALDRFNEEFPPEAKDTFQRDAYEVVHRLCDVLAALIHDGVARFDALRGREDWQGLIHSLLTQRSLLCSADRAREFAARLLWDGAPTITGFYHKLVKKLADLQTRFGGKAVHCNLRVANLLLDMALHERVEAQPAELPAIVAVERDGAVVLQAAAGGGARLFTGAEDVALFQALLWEIVVPINGTNLKSERFRGFLNGADLLDFPGVSNLPASNSQLINVWPGLSETQLAALVPEQEFNAGVFFRAIVKNGKTACIVCSYAARLLIDGFTILCFLDKNAMAKADQIKAGLNTWWRCMAPDYNPELGGRSPLPLNLGLTWWKELFDNHAVLGRQGKSWFSTKDRVIGSLGRASSPTVVWRTCALNYYKFKGRGAPADEKTFCPEEMFGVALQDKELRKQFCAERKWVEQLDNNSVDAIKARRAELTGDAGLESIWNMLEDRRKGGAESLINTLLGQLDARASGGRTRAGILAEIKQREAARLERLLQGEFMIPPAEPRDLRRESLERFQTALTTAVTREGQGLAALAPEPEMRRINLALRDLLNVDYRDLDILPTANSGITPDFIRQQFHGWVRKQAARWRDGAKSPAEARGPRPEWTVLGLTSPAFVEAVLTALVESLHADEFTEIARWLREDVRAAHQDGIHGGRRDNHVPYLATRMANALIGPPARAEVDEENKPMSYAIFVEPFLQNRLPELINAPTRMMVKVDVPGTQELRDLCATFNVLPGSADNQPEAA